MIYLITGANRGIGLQLTRQLLARGDRVVAACRRPDAATALHEMQASTPAGRLMLVQLDVTDPASIAACYATVKQHTDTLDVLINNAGAGPSHEPLGGVDQKVLLRTYAVNTAGPLLMAQQFLPLVEAGAAKKIINLSSGVGSITNCATGSNYAYYASKAALNMVTKQLSLAVADAGITCIVIDPGWVKTEMGGPNAKITPETSVTGLLSVIDALTPAQNGAYLDYRGNSVPW